MVRLSGFDKADLRPPRWLGADPMLGADLIDTSRPRHSRRSNPQLDRLPGALGAGKPAVPCWL